jgi:hypothetical protein
MATVEHRNQPLTAAEVRQIRELRYMDGLTQMEVAQHVGCYITTVRKYAPGYPGKIDNTLLREAFLRSGLTGTEVARRIGWTCQMSKRSRDGAKLWRWDAPDGARVRKALGLVDDVNGRGWRSRRTMIDAEAAALMAEAIGVAPWSVGCCD